MFHHGVFAFFFEEVANVLATCMQNCRDYHRPAYRRLQHLYSASIGYRKYADRAEDKLLAAD